MLISERSFFFQVKKLQVNEMQDSEEIKSMKYLVGPIKSFNEGEFKIYRCSHLCMTKANKVDGKSTSSPSQRAGLETCICIKRKAKAMKAAAKASSVSPQNGRGSRGYSTQSSEGMDVFANQACEQCLFVPRDNLPEPLFQQTYSKWKAALDLNFQLRKMRKKRVIYIQPIDDFPEFVTEFNYGGSKPGFFNLLQEFARTFFQGFEVRILPNIHLEETDWNVSVRSHHVTQKKQYMASDIYKNLGKVLPKDGYCILGISWTDLYPSEDLNFVLGEASQENRAGAFCFGRYEPKAYKDGQAPPPLDRIDGEILWRMLKVSACHSLWTIRAGH
jgi:hypothetical protein